MRVAVTGSTGLLGTALLAALDAAQHETWRVVRREMPGVARTIAWDPAGGTIDAAKFEALDAVIHLSGENLAGGKWTRAFKQRAYDSRVGSTELLARTLAQLKSPPRTLVTMSGINYYGDCGDTEVDESQVPGSGFLSDLCVFWERAALPAAAAGVRVVTFRAGVVLTPRGGALKEMLPAFKAGLGGPIGGGQQFMSWLTLDDAVAAFLFALNTPELAGAVNLCSPLPVTNREFVKTLGRVLGRPAVMPLPAWVVRALFGEMGQSFLLESQRAAPRQLLDSGFQFRYAELEPALRHLLM